MKLANSIWLSVDGRMGSSARGVANNGRTNWSGKGDGSVPPAGIRSQ
jgi:hypothetical protein